jgi:carbon-monoxide dehydrogenase small subunit
VLVDGAPVLSCLALPAELEGRAIATVEGMADGGRLHPLQQAFAELGAAQCGYCTPGVLLTAQALLAEQPTPTRDEIRAALAGNLCRCTGYTKILEAVELAALRMTSPPAGRTAAGRSASRGAPRGEASGEMAEDEARVPAP